MKPPGEMVQGLPALEQEKREKGTRPKRDGRDLYGAD